MSTNPSTSSPQELFRQDLRLQMAEMRAARDAEAQSPFNLWVAGIRLGHSPTPEEARRHWEQFGAFDFGARYRQTHSRGFDSTEATGS